MNDELFQPAKAVFMVTSVDFRALLATLNLVPRSLVADADEDLPLTAVSTKSPKIISGENV